MKYRYLILLIIFCSATAGCQQQSVPLEREQFLMDTLITIKSYDASLIGQTKTSAALKEAFNEIRSAERVLNIHDQASEAARLNRLSGKEGPLKISPLMTTALAASQKISTLTAGGFDPTIGPISRLWRFRRDDAKIPRPSELKETLAFVGAGNITLDRTAKTVVLPARGMRLDFGGIAKGIALDQANAELKRHGLKRALISSVSGTKALGPKPDGRPWLIGIQSPRPKKRPGIIGVIELMRGSVSTSGDYQQFFVKNGRRYHHILDPKTGRPARSFMSVTVVTKRNAAFADALSTGLFTLSPPKARALVRELSSVEAIFINPEGGIWISPGIREKVRDLKSGDSLF